MPLFFDPDGPLSHLEIRHEYGDQILLCDQWDANCAEPLQGPATKDHKLYFSGPGVYDLEVTGVDDAGARSETVRLRVNWTGHVTLLDYAAPSGKPYYRPFLEDGSMFYVFMRDLIPQMTHVYLVPFQGGNLAASDLEQLVNDGDGYDLELYPGEGELFVPLCYGSLPEQEGLSLNDCWETTYEGLGEQISLYVASDGEVLLEKHYVLAEDAVTVAEIFNRYLESGNPILPVDDFYLQLLLHQLTPVTTRFSF